MKTRMQILEDGDVEAFAEWMAANNPGGEPHGHMAEIALHKVRCAVDELPLHLRQESALWLRERGFGHCPVPGMWPHFNTDALFSTTREGLVAWARFYGVRVRWWHTARAIRRRLLAKRQAADEAIQKRKERERWRV